MTVIRKALAAVVAAGFVAAGVAVSDSIVTAASGVVSVAPGDVQLAGRTNVHSGGRAGGKALPRLGNTNTRKSTGWH